MYQALYRKYRPQHFDDVFGQKIIVQTLKNSIITGKIGHAYMFFGPRGTGKTTLSKIFARAVNCESPVNGDSCGKCSRCVHSYEKELKLLCCYSYRYSGKTFEPVNHKSHERTVFSTIRNLVVQKQTCKHVTHVIIL